MGYTQQTPTEDRYLLKESELLDRLDVLLGGRIAEKIVYGDVSTGPQNDLQRATDMARQMITQFGMNEQLGLATYEDMPSPLFNGTGMMPHDRKEYSEETARTIDAEVPKILALASQAMSLAAANLEEILPEKRYTLMVALSLVPCRHLAPESPTSKGSKRPARR